MGDIEPARMDEKAPCEDALDPCGGEEPLLLDAYFPLVAVDGP